MHSAVEQGPFMTGHARSVIGEEKYDGISRQTILFQLPENFSHFLIHRTHTVMKTGHGLADNWCVRIVRREGYIGRIMNLIIR